MHGRRNVTGDIWRAVVMAGAMLGSGVGCGSSAPAPDSPAAPAPMSEEKPAEQNPAETKPDETVKNDDEKKNPCAKPDDGATKGTDNPCARPRGKDDGFGPKGRGFILA